MSKYKKHLIIIVLGLIIIAAGGTLLLGKSKENNSEMPSWSWMLGGKTIIIDAGHGGVDPGAVGINNTLEKDINLDIAKRLNLLLVQAGCNVVMLREEDRDFGHSSNLLQRKREDLAYRIQKAMDARADIYLSIHANSFPDQRQYGPQVFYHPSSQEGEVLAVCIQNSLNKLSSKKRAAKANQSYFILKNADMLAVTVEAGFLSNPEEEAKLTQEEYQMKVAMAIFEGLGDYFTKK
jgi:N-acetylmuramoyl-L-alanine amidase